MMRRDKKAGLETLKHYNPNIDAKLIEDSYDNCGWNYEKPPQVWIETLIGWMKEDKLIQKDVTLRGRGGHLAAGRAIPATRRRRS